MVSEEGATPETAGTRYSVNSTSQYGGVPFLLNKRSMVVLGEYVSYSNFSVDNGEDFSVASATLGAGYSEERPSPASRDGLPAMAQAPTWDDGLVAAAAVVGAGVRGTM